MRGKRRQLQTKRGKNGKFEKRWGKYRTQNHIEEICQDRLVITVPVNGTSWPIGGKYEDQT